MSVKKTSDDVLGQLLVASCDHASAGRHGLYCRRGRRESSFASSTCQYADLFVCLFYLRSVFRTAVFVRLVLLLLVVTLLHARVMPFFSTVFNQFELFSLIVSWLTFFLVRSVYKRTQYLCVKCNSVGVCMCVVSCRPFPKHLA